jgi:hypothetical protein
MLEKVSLIYYTNHFLSQKFNTVTKKKRSFFLVDYYISN